MDYLANKTAVKPCSWQVHELNGLDQNILPLLNKQKPMMYSRLLGVLSLSVAYQRVLLLAFDEANDFKKRVGALSKRNGVKAH